MNDLNSILIEGNLVREPQYRTTPRGTPLCTFPIATNRFYKQNGEAEKETSFFNIEAWVKIKFLYPDFFPYFNPIFYKVEIIIPLLSLKNAQNLLKT